MEAFLLASLLVRLNIGYLFGLSNIPTCPSSYPIKTNQMREDGNCEDQHAWPR